MRNNSKNFQIVFPAYNEEGRIARAINRTLKFLKSNNFKGYSILIADNLSTDNTSKIGRNLSRKHKEVSYMRINKKGVGVALKTSWSKSDFGIIGYMDVDLSTDLVHIREALDILNSNKADIVIGSRLRKGSSIRNRTILRELASRSYNSLLNYCFDVKFTDAVCGFKFLNKKVFDKLMGLGIDNDEWFFDTELLVKAEWNNLRVVEIPVKWEDSSESKVDIIDTIVKYIKSIIKLKREEDAYKSKL